MLGGSVVISVVMGGVVGEAVGGGPVQEPVYYQERRLDVIYTCICVTYVYAH